MARKRDWKSVNRNSNIVWSSYDQTGPKILYRYMPLVQLISLLETGRLTLLNPSSWPDKTEEGWSRKLFAKDAPMDGVCARAVCFTRESYCEALWQIYARSGPVVRVNLDCAVLLDGCEKFEGSGKFYIGDVWYRTENEMHESLESAITTKKLSGFHSSSAATLMLLKRRAFAYEKEIRLIWLTRDSINGSIDISVPVDKLIKKLLISPYAENWVVDTIRSLIEKTYNLKCVIEQSTLNRAPQWMQC